MYSLITFATQWGSKHGGINSFNTDFLKTFGIAYHTSAQVVCIVADASDDEIEKARNAYDVTLLKLPYPPQAKTFSIDQAQAGVDLLKQRGINFDPEHTLWLGHDRITGAAAIEAAKIAGGRSALIHHMSYAHYESFAEDSQTAHLKNQEQQSLFGQVDLILAIGPLLRDAAHDLVGGAKPVHMLVPGLAEIEAQTAPKTFVAFLGGRLSGDAARVKQGYLSVAALAHAHKKACEISMPDGLCKQPRLMLRGVDFAAEGNGWSDAKPEAKLKAFAEQYADRAITVLALPYTHDRDELYSNISRASAVMMLSWHEGFGLAAWEAIAAGVPLIISKHSGVYKLLEESHPGCEKGFVYPIDVRGTSTEPFFRPEDLEAVAVALREIARQPEKARQKAGTLRGLLLNEYSWAACAEQAAKIFSWPLQKGILPPVAQKPITPAQDIAEPQFVRSALPVHMPEKRWQADGGFADSQLLRAEEQLVPFDSARQPELDKLNTWLDDADYPQAVRLLTGAGGLGKTRLALHLCQQRITSGWYAGFMDGDLATKDLADGWKALKALKQPLLIVIDYAETRQDSLLALLRAMLQLPADQLVRLLLLARDGGEWWDNLPGKDKTCESLLAGYATSGPYHLLPLHADMQDRRHAYVQALNAFAEALGVHAPDVIPELAGEHFGHPLYLQMAALLALHGERPTTAQGLTRALLNHERRYWRALFSGDDIPQAEHHAELLLALTTLAGGFATPKAALSFWERANGKILSPAQFKNLFHALIPLYPGKQGLQAVRPDLLGEALVAQALLRPSAGGLLDAVLGKEGSQTMRQHALTVIARLSGHYEELHEALIEALARQFTHCWQEFTLAAAETPGGLPAMGEAAWVRLLPNIRNQVAGLLELNANNESIQLANFYCLLHGTLVEKNRLKWQKKSSAMDAEDSFASKLNNFSVALYRAGRDDAALAHARQALEIRERLAKKNPDRFDPDYSASLSNYANRLGDAGRDDAALAHARQALEIRERLAKKNPARFSEDQFSTAYNVYFLAWLVGNGGASGLAERPTIPASTTPHRRSLLQLYAGFIQACHAPDAVSRADGFKQVVQLWNELSRANKTSAVNYWLCAAAWCGTYELSAVVNVDWQSEWYHFVSRRQGHVPCWMKTVAQRLEFKWPE
ncbi:MAG: tetratricopeptide repeat protein [Candidatus Nitrotoga sp.]